jgi:protease-4
MNNVEKEAMQRTIETTYTDFVNKVSAGRKMTFNAVDSIAQGRVWSGSDAMKIGLVDGFGGLTAAVEEAAKMAGLEAWSLRELPVSEDPLLKVLSQFGAEMKTRILSNELGEFERIFDDLREIRDISGIQARLPYFIEVH